MKSKIKGQRAILLLQCLFFFSFADHLPAQSSSRWSREKYVNTEGDTLNYRLLYPDYNLSRKYPLVIFLHGSGERGNDNEAQLKWGVANFSTDRMMALHPAIVIAPQCPGNQDWCNFDEQAGVMDPGSDPTRPMALVIELIHQCMKTMPVDTDRVYITGLSSGGFGTFDAITRHPHLFAAAVPVCGGGDASRASSIAHIPIWIFHGSEDPGVPPGLSIDMANALIKAGAHPGLTLYPGVGHFSWLQAYSDPVMIEWLFSQHKQED